MKNFKETCILLWLCILLYSGHGVISLSYDYSATTKCLAEPLPPQYDGGIISNPEFNRSINEWIAFGNGEIKERMSDGGNRFIVMQNRSEQLDSVSQTVELEEGMIYTFSAWIRLSEGSEVVAVIFKTDQGELVRGGSVTAQQGCWSFLKGGIVANFSGPVNILFQCKNVTVEVWVDNISLQPFSKKQWGSHQDKIVQEVRKRKVKFQVTYSNGTAVESATVSIQQITSEFPFGCGINHHILNSTDYQEWFISRFNVATFTNEMKWYSTELKHGQENYTVADAMVKFAKENNISIRGHNIFWDDPKYQPDWVQSLSSEELRNASERRINSIVPRYRGQLIAWDVVNENLHFNFYESELGQNASAAFFAKAYQLDPETTMFMNEYNTTECPDDEEPSPFNYVKKIQEILSFPGTSGMKVGIGVQGRFSAGQPNIAYMRASQDILASTGLPIWYTEVSIDEGPNQAEILEEVLREAYSYPAVEGIVSFSGPKAAGFKVMPLTDKNFKNTPNGDVIDKLLDEWISGTQVVLTVGLGSFEVSLFHGDYNAIVEYPKTNSSTTISLKVTQDNPMEVVQIKLND